MARQQQDVDELFEIKNFFYIGNYQQCLNEAQKLRKVSTPEVAVERDIFTYRAYMAQKKFLVILDEIKPSSHEKIQPLKMLAEYLHQKNRRDAIIADLDQMMSGNVSVDNDTLIIVAATIYMNEKNYEAAYRVLHTSESLEAMALILDILLKINRLDLAKKKLKEMLEKDDDATLTQLAQAWCNVAIGGEKTQEAFYIYQEMVDKYGSTPMLLNGQAVTFISQGKYEEASVALHEALDKDPNYPDTLINMIVLAHCTGKEAEVSNRYLSQLKESHSEHPYLKDLQTKEMEFERLCTQYTFSKPASVQG
ncbi:PREDICTED: coatomer subunit epsilon [Nicrophorus vespilloides]|uniref:Coatomer subunit epsilon n=1 Tax=Nicrophorus vespilloides TaxID=110193 RepID=A0ABM1M851_NICVS|nr:PREDICTED: coatomer subunit epsilon [Nicrophorus vespilloides]